MFKKIENLTVLFGPLPIIQRHHNMMPYPADNCNSYVPILKEFLLISTYFKDKTRWRGKEIATESNQDPLSDRAFPK